MINPLRALREGFVALADAAKEHVSQCRKEKEKKKTLPDPRYIESDLAKSFDSFVKKEKEK